MALALVEPIEVTLLRPIQTGENRDDGGNLRWKEMQNMLRDAKLDMDYRPVLILYSGEEIKRRFVADAFEAARSRCKRCTQAAGTADESTRKFGRKERS